MHAKCSLCRVWNSRESKLGDRQEYLHCERAGNIGGTHIPAISFSQFYNLFSRSQERLKLDWVKIWLVYHVLGSDLCLKSSPQDNRNQHSKIVFQQFVVTTVVLGLIFWVEHYLYCFPSSSEFWPCLHFKIIAIGCATMTLSIPWAFKFCWYEHI